MKKRLIALAMIAAMILGCMSALIVPTLAVAPPEIVEDGLIAWYDGINNSNGEHTTTAKIWRDLSGNRRHMKVTLGEDNYWQDNAFHIKDSYMFFNEELIPYINGDEFTIEIALGEYEPSPTMNDRWVLFYSNNTELFFGYRNDKGNPADKGYEFKYNDDNKDRPYVVTGEDPYFIKNQTIAITFNFNEKICNVYFNGELVETGVPEYKLNADQIYISGNDTNRSFEGDIHGLRFYDRALEADEIAENAASDEKKYRSGNKYDIEEMYDDSDEDLTALQGKTYYNNVVPVDRDSNVIDTENWYGNEMLTDYMYPYDADVEAGNGWTGARIQYEDDGTGAAEPNFTINYRAFCALNGLTPINTGDAGWVVLKLQAENTTGDLRMVALLDDAYSIHDAGAYTTPSEQGELQGTGEVEYLIYDIADLASGQVNYLKIYVEEMTEEAVIYLHEVSFFATMEEAYDYAGIVLETEPEETEPEEETHAQDQETEAKDTQAQDQETQAQAQGTEAQGTDAEGTDATTDEGCGSVVGFGAAALLAAAAAAVVLKKKD